MAQIDRIYVILALVLLILGEALGFYMGMAADTKFRTLHIAFVLVGFVTFAIFGVLYRLWPMLKDGALAVAQFWLTVIGIAGIIVGTYQFTVSGAVPIIATGSAITILGTLLLAWMFWRRSAA